MMKLVHRCYSNRTVYALSSGQGKCGVAVIRVSGPKAKDALKYIGSFSALPKPRQAILRKLRNVNNGDIIDKAIVLWFPDPNGKIAFGGFLRLS